MFSLVQKCKLLKKKSKDWNQKSFGNTYRQLRIVDEKLKNIQAHLLSREDDVRLLQQQHQDIYKREKLLAFNTTYWKQRSKINYQFKGDVNSKFFHAHASIRRNRNLIKEITTSRGEIISNPTLILDELTNEFKKRFTRNDSSFFDVNEDFKLLEPVISDDDNQFYVPLSSGKK